VLGKGEVKQSLGTRDPAEAKRLYAEAQVALDQQWANLRKGPQSLSERQAHELARPIEAWFVKQNSEHPSRQTLWNVDIGATLWQPACVDLDLTLSPVEILTQPLEKNTVRRREMRTWCEKEARSCLSAQGLEVDEDGQANLARAIAQAMQRAALTLKRFSEGEYPLQPRMPSDRQVPISNTLVRTTHTPELKFDVVFQEWAAERKPVEKTRYSFQAVLKQLQTFVGHDDAGRLTAEDLVRWKMSLLESGLQAKTIRDSKLAPIKAILQTAVDNRRLPVNPATKITVPFKSKGRVSKGYTDDEARAILRAASQARDPLRRWVPWLCAYSGARISEICQLRVEDIITDVGVPCMRITAEAGSVKNSSSERIVPLHPALIQEGFLAFVRAHASGALFTGIEPDRFGNRGGNGTKVLGRWVHSLFDGGVSKQPNHAWRHRFATLVRNHGLRQDVSLALTGHAQINIGGNYGDYSTLALFNELQKIPVLKIDDHPG